MFCLNITYTVADRRGPSPNAVAKSAVALLAVTSLAFHFAGCSTTPVDDEKLKPTKQQTTLESLGYGFTEQDFLRSVIENNAQVAKLFLARGMSVSTSVDPYVYAGFSQQVDRSQVEVIQEVALVTEMFKFPHSSDIGRPQATNVELDGIRADGFSEELTVLDFAAAHNNLEVMRVLLDSGADPTHSVLFAVGNGHSQPIRMLAEAGAAVPSTSTAAAIGAIDALSTLLELGGEPEGITWAAANGDQWVVDILLEHGAQPDGVRNAAKEGHTEIVRTLLAAGAAPEGIHLAAYNGHIEIVKLLLEAGAEPQGIGGARSNGHKEIVELLLAAGAEGDPSVFDLN